MAHSKVTFGYCIMNAFNFVHQEWKLLLQLCTVQGPLHALGFRLSLSQG